MQRFEDSPALFGVTVGGGTSGNVSCDWCGKDFTDRQDANGEAFDHSETIAIDHFGDKQICDCCFALVEAAVIQAMPNILPWYIRLLKTRQARLEELFGNLGKLKEALKEL
jgi:hypothetical protein